MGMMYSAQISGSAQTLAQDVFELLAPADAVIVVHEVWIGQITEAGDAAAEMLLAQFKRASGSYTSGSGGSSPTKAPLDFGYAAAGATLEANNTTQASAGTGALTTLRSQSFNVQAGLHYLPTPESRIVLSPSQALLVSVSAPADSVTFDATIVWEEIGG